jgi:flotillin
LIEKLPEIARAIAEPMGRNDRITIVGTGNGMGTGASKITQDIGQVLAELPPVVKALSGVDLQDLINKLPELAEKKIKEKQAAPSKDGAS